MLVQGFLETTASRLPGKTALICGGRRHSYREIDAAATRLAAALVQCGVRRGDRVIVYLDNSVEAVTGIFAALKANAVFAVINPSTRLEKLAWVINNCEARALVADGRLVPEAALDSLAALCPSLQTCVMRNAATPAKASRLVRLDLRQIEDCPAICPPRVCIDLDLACLVYTSGSTGEPKGVMSDHSNVVFASGSIISYLKNSESDVVLNTLPLSFDYGLYQLLMTFRFGGTLVLADSFAFPAVILETVEREQVTALPGVPTMFALLLRMDTSAFNLSTLRYITNTAAALPASHILELQRKFPSATIYSMYGLTETKRTLYLPPEQVQRRPGSVGIAIPGTEVWVEDEQGRRLGPNQVGELVVRGRHVMRGYWADPAASALRFRPGSVPGERLCFTGDLFRMDEEGFFYFVARKDDIIKSRGEKVAPREIENVLHAMPGVAEAAVIGVPDELLGEAIKAFIVADGLPLTKAGVLAHCRRHLENYLVPQQVEFRDSLPKTPSGKIDKKVLH